MADAQRGDHPVYLLKGGDEVILANAARELVDSLVGDADPTEVLTEFVGDDHDLGEILIAASTVSMFGRRVVVARNMGRFSAKQLAPLLAHLEQPPPDTTLVLVWDRPTTPGASAMPVGKKLSDAVAAAGGVVVDTAPPSQGKRRDVWADEVIDASGVRLDASARRHLKERLGEDVARLDGILSVLTSVFGSDDRTLTVDDIEPYMGEAGAVPSWDLTDAIDSGDVPGAIANLHRMISGGGRHPLQVMATLQTHVERIARLDGAGVRDEKAAAALLGMKGSSFPAKKAMNAASRLGPARIARAVQLLAGADLDVRGRSGQPPEVVMDVLVARLASLSRGGTRSRR